MHVHAPFFILSVVTSLVEESEYDRYSCLYRSAFHMKLQNGLNMSENLDVSKLYSSEKNPSGDFMDFQMANFQETNHWILGPCDFTKILDPVAPQPPAPSVTGFTGCSPPQRKWNRP